MKRNISTLLLSLVFIITAAEGFCQFNPMTNSYDRCADNRMAEPAMPDIQIRYSSLSGVVCTDNTFWAITSTGADLFTLNNDTIKKTGTTNFTTPFDPNLAFCNNLNGGAYNPTFYSTKNFNQPVYFDSTRFINSTDSFPDKLINCGGSRDFLYYISYDTSFKAKAIVRYTGSSFLQVYSFHASETATVADLAVDSSGNVFFFTGINNGALVTDTLNVISSTGQLLKQYPLLYNTYNAYGCFLLHGKLYVGLGPSNLNHPNTVLPVTLTATSAIAGIPIAMPVTTVYSDMASCSTSSPPFSVNENKPLSGISVYPNPAGDHLSIDAGTWEILDLRLYDFSSKELVHQSFNHSLMLMTGQLSKGIYLYRISNRSGAVKSGIIVKQ